MWKKIFLSFGAPALALTAFGFAQERSEEPWAKVICCGECKPGDDCLVKCEVVGKVPAGVKITCCGKCQKGDNCLEECSSKSTCCETK